MHEDLSYATSGRTDLNDLLHTKSNLTAVTKIDIGLVNLIVNNTVVRLNVELSQDGS